MTDEYNAKLDAMLAANLRIATVKVDDDGARWQSAFGEGFSIGPAKESDGDAIRLHAAAPGMRLALLEVLKWLPAECGDIRDICESALWLGGENLIETVYPLWPNWEERKDELLRADAEWKDKSEAERREAQTRRAAA